MRSLVIHEMLKNYHFSVSDSNFVDDVRTTAGLLCSFILLLTEYFELVGCISGVAMI